MTTTTQTTITEPTISLEVDQPPPRVPGPIHYTTYRLPKHTPHLPLLAQKWRAVRLDALQQRPHILASTYELEVTFSEQVWLDTLQNPLFERFVAVVHSPPAAAEEGEGEDKEQETQQKYLQEEPELNPEPDMEILLNHEWVGMISLRGPMPLSDYILPGNGSPTPLPDNLETRWHLTSLYTLPSYRGHGIAKRIIHSCTAYAVSHNKIHLSAIGTAEQDQVTRIRLFVHPTNQLVFKLYKGEGYHLAGKTTLVEAMTANGDEVPEDTESDVPLYHTRWGIGMEQVTKGGVIVVGEEVDEKN